MMEHPAFDKSASSSIGLWWSDGRVVGAAIYDMYFGEAFCGVLPGHETLYPDILDYACRELKDDSWLAVAINEKNVAEIKAALQAGFERIDQKETIMELSLDRDFSLDPRRVRAGLAVLGSVLALGIPNALSTLLSGFASTFSNQLLSTHSTEAIAAMAAAGKSSLLISMVQMGICMGIQPLRQGLLLIPLLYLFHWLLGLTGIAAAHLATDVTAAALALLIFLLHYHRMKKELG